MAEIIADNGNADDRHEYAMWCFEQARKLRFGVRSKLIIAAGIIGLIMTFAFVQLIDQFLTRRYISDVMREEFYIGCAGVVIMAIAGYFHRKDERDIEYYEEQGHKALMGEKY